MIDVFAGIDRSTARHRIEGSGERLYEAKNVFPYLQGRLQRRFDIVDTNSRDSNSAFPTFPVQSVTSALVLDVIEFNNTICIFYEDTGDPGKLMMDSFDIGANTLTARIAKSIGITITTGGPLEARPYNTGSGTTSGTLAYAALGLSGTTVRYIKGDWTLASFTSTAATCRGQCEVFLQSFHFTTTDKAGKYKRTAPAATSTYVAYTLADDIGEIIKLLSFGYQTSSAGATSALLIFKPASTWLQTGIGSTESLEQLSGNIGLIGKDAIAYTPFGVVFVGKDRRGMINLYMLDRNSLVFHTIGHELYEELNDIPAVNQKDVVVSFDRNRLIRIALTKTGDSLPNLQEYWMDFYNGLKKRTIWGPFPIPVDSSLFRIVEFSGGDNAANAGLFALIKKSDVYKIYEETNNDTFDSTNTGTDDQIYRTKIYDFGNVYAIVPRMYIVALANGAKFDVYYEVLKASGDDNNTTQTLIGSYQMGTSGLYESKPIRIVPGVLVRQIGFKIISDYDVSDNNPFELSQFGFDYEITNREVIE
jgi:hypothetical protein